MIFAAFVAGVKMALPSSMERVNNSKYEEINIPVNEGPPLEVGNTLVPISSLDEIGRKAFANCKTLNRYPRLLLILQVLELACNLLVIMKILL